MLYLLFHIFSLCVSVTGFQVKTPTSVQTDSHTNNTIAVPSDCMVQPQTDRDWFRNVSNLDLVEPKQIRDLIQTCIRLLFANFLMLKT